jgi:hemin uptake protein HemP
MTNTELAVALVAGLMSEAEPARLETPASPTARWTSAQLLAGHRESVIEHNGVEYRLRLTGQGKLILTK